MRQRRGGHASSEADQEQKVGKLVEIEFVGDVAHQAGMGVVDALADGADGADGLAGGKIAVSLPGLPRSAFELFGAFQFVALPAVAVWAAPPLAIQLATSVTAQSLRLPTVTCGGSAPGTFSRLLIVRSHERSDAASSFEVSSFGRSGGGVFVRSGIS